MSTENGKAPNGWKVAGLALAVIQILLGLLYADLRADQQRTEEKVDGLTAISVRLATVEATLNSVDARTVRLENKLDAALDRNATFRNATGPR